MHFTSALALVFATAALAAPTVNSSTTTTAAAAAPTAPAAPAIPGLSLTAQLAIADTAVDRFNLLPNDNQFVFDFGDPKKRSTNPNGDIIPATRKTFPALVSTGASMTIGFLGPCAFNTPHVHPRSGELLAVLEGRLVTEMVPENGVFRNGDPKQGRRVITNTLNKFQMEPFYAGSVHTQYNPDCTNVTFVGAFTSEDFGVGQIADEFLALSPDIVSAVFGNTVDGAEISKFKNAVSVNIAKGVEECLKKCGIPKR